jgi:hypothetical protein
MSWNDLYILPPDQFEKLCKLKQLLTRSISFLYDIDDLDDDTVRSILHEQDRIVGLISLQQESLNMLEKINIDVVLTGACDSCVQEEELSAPLSRYHKMGKFNCDILRCVIEILQENLFLFFLRNQLDNAINILQKLLIFSQSVAIYDSRSYWMKFTFFHEIIDQIYPAFTDIPLFYRNKIQAILNQHKEEMILALRSYTLCERFSVLLFLSIRVNPENSDDIDTAKKILKYYDNILDQKSDFFNFNELTDIEEKEYEKKHSILNEIEERLDFTKTINIIISSKKDIQWARRLLVERLKKIDALVQQF